MSTATIQSGEQHPKSTQELKYNPQFDGMRFCAVLLVASYHWLPEIGHQPLSPFFGGLVNFFFVLSSYLITRILFSAKQKSIQLEVPWYKFMGVFLLRRTIRIFPAYYLFLIIVIILPGVGMAIKAQPGMYFSYLANYQMYYSLQFPSVAAHIWTLAVEEQFYLVWPLIIFLVPREQLPKLLLLVIGSVLVLKAVCYVPEAGVMQSILTQYSVDAFALGSLLAYKVMAGEKEQQLITRYVNLALWILLPVAVVMIVLQSDYFSFVLNRFVFALASYKLIEGGVYGYKNTMGKFLELKWVTFLGRISYGIYLYHLLIPVLFWKLYKIVMTYGQSHHPAFFIRNKKAISIFKIVLASHAVSYVIYAALTVLVAYLSWKYMETPLNKFKIGYKASVKKDVTVTA